MNLKIKIILLFVSTTIFSIAQMRKFHTIMILILGSTFLYPIYGQNIDCDGNQIVGYTCEEIILWGNDTPPLNKEGVNIAEVVDEEGRRFSKISNPVMYLYRKTGVTEPGPAVMYIPGGGYSQVSMLRKGKSTAETFFDMGFSVVAILKYRLPDPEIVNDQEKVPLYDAQKALSLLHTNAVAWNIDRTKIGVKGASAGGHLAASLNNLKEEILAPGVSINDLDLAFAILRVSVISFSDPELTVNVGSVGRLLGDKVSDNDLKNLFSMEKQVDAQTSPTFLVYATDDESVPYQNSVAYANELQENNIRYQSVELNKGGHTFGFSNAKVDQDWVTMLDNWLQTVLDPSSGPIVSTLPVYESFAYTVGSQIISENQTIGIGSWSTTGPRSNACDVLAATPPSWSIPNIKVPTGNAIEFSGSGVKPELLFTPQTGDFGKIYASALIKVTDASNIDSNPSRFIGFGRLHSSGSVSNSTCIFVRSDGNGGYNLGVNESSSTTGITWDSTNYVEDQELMVIFGDGGDGTAKLWINPELNGIEPLATVQDTGIRNQDVDRIQIYQHASTNTPKMFLDELRIGKTWISVTEKDKSVAELPAYESFDYALNNKLIQDDVAVGLGNWSTLSPDSNSDAVIVASPTWSGISGINSPTGNALQYQGGGVDPEFLFTPQTGDFGTIYASGLIKVSSIASLDTDAARLFGFGYENSGGSVSGSTFSFIRLDTSGTGFNLGVNHTNSNSGITWGDTVYNVNQELMLVLYFDDSNTGTTAKLWVNPVINGTEPLPTLTDPDSRNFNVDRIQLFQANSADTPLITFDELRVGKTWTSVTNDAANLAEKKIFLKLDDLDVEDGTISALSTVQYLIDRKIKASYGIIADRNDETSLSSFGIYLNVKNDEGEPLIEIWNHGLNHQRDPIEEFKQSYNEQKQHFEDAHAIFNDLFRVKVRTFGAPYNKTDENTNTVVSENDDYKVTFFQNPVPNPSTGILNLNNRVNIENGTGNVDYDFFITDYNDHKDDYTDFMVLQGHPNGWDTTKLNEFDRIIDFLIAEGWTFELPYNYYLQQNPSVSVPNTDQTITFPEISDKTLGEANFDPGATSSSNLQVLYNSSNHNVAEIVDSNVQIKGIGTTIITASQMGNETYKRADYVSRTLTVTSVSSEPTIATLPAYESFDYSINSQLIQNNASVGLGNWSTLSSHSNSDAVIVNSPSWSSINGINLPKGNALNIEGGGVDPEFLFTPQNGDFGTVYASGLIKVTSIASLNTDTARLFGFGRQNSGGSFSGSTFAFIRLDAGGIGFNLGVNETNSTSGITWSDTVYNVDQELMLVLYFDDSNTGTTAKLWVNPVINGVEPLPTLTDPDSRNSNVDRIQLNQTSSSGTPLMVFDELRVGKTWSSVTDASMIWNGVTSDWNTANNWSTSSVPTNSDNVMIPSGTSKDPVIDSSTGVTVQNLIVDSGAVLSIASGGSLIVGGVSSGNIKYTLGVTDDNWHLISSPVEGERYNSAWVTSNSIASGSNSSSNRGIATYDNSRNDDVTEYWRYMQENDDVPFNNAQGYSIKKVPKTSGSFTNNIEFIGSYSSSDVSFTITRSNSNWNLIGNPYPSYIGITSFLSSSMEVIDNSFLAIYVWNAEQSVFSYLNTGYIHPGQAFFVNSSSNTATINFLESMQSHQTGVTFYKSNNTIPKINIVANVDNRTKQTDLLFTQDKSYGLDPGFDIGLFDGVSTDFSVYTQLLETDSEVAFAQQSLPNDALNNVVVPIGLKAKEGSIVKLSLNQFNIPAGIKVYLEDSIANTVTDLSDSESEYTVTLSEDLKGLGRFYLKTSNTPLNTENIIKKPVTIHHTNRTLTIQALDSSSFKVSVYSVLGSEVFSKSYFSVEATKKVTLPSLKLGVYIVRLESDTALVNKKIVLR